MKKKKKYSKPSIVPLSGAIYNLACPNGNTPSPGLCAAGGTDALPTSQCINGSNASPCKCAAGFAGEPADPCSSGYGGICKT